MYSGCGHRLNKHLNLFFYLFFKCMNDASSYNPDRRIETAVISSFFFFIDLPMDRIDINRISAILYNPEKVNEWIYIIVIVS